MIPTSIQVIAVKKNPFKSPPIPLELTDFLYLSDTMPSLGYLMYPYALTWAEDWIGDGM